MSVVLNAARQKACVYVGYVVVTLETYTVVFFKWSVWVIGLGCNESEVDSTDIGGWDVFGIFSLTFALCRLQNVPPVIIYS